MQLAFPSLKEELMTLELTLALPTALTYHIFSHGSSS